jgi:D-alanine-D-alanine ligase
VTAAPIPPPLRPVVLKLARDAYRSIGAEGFARIDFLLAGETLVLSEINTIPGFTPISLFPAMAAAGGYDFAGVCRRILDLAIARHAGRSRIARLTTDDLPR